MKRKISQAVIKRLPRYYRCLQALNAIGDHRVSSARLAAMLDVTASQVRQDFCNFGGFGQQGYGYDVPNLLSELSKIMGLDKKYNCIIIGAGNIGHALAGYKGFADSGFTMKAVFDVVTPSDEVKGVPLYHIDKLADYLNENIVDIAVIATQAEVANEISGMLVKMNVKNIWNFAPCDLAVTDNAIVENISMSESLYVLTYRMNNEEINTK